jgi:hypothetical protein
MKILPILLGAVAALGALVAAVKLSEASPPAKAPTKPDAKPATPPAPAPASPPAVAAPPVSPVAGLPVTSPAAKAPHAPKAHTPSSPASATPPAAPGTFAPPAGTTDTKGLETLGGPRPLGDLPAENFAPPDPPAPIDPVSAANGEKVTASGQPDVVTVTTETEPSAADSALDSIKSLF